MSSSEFTKRLRQILTTHVTDAELEKFFLYLDSEVRQISLEQDEGIREEFEDKLQTIFNEKLDSSDIQHLKLCLRVLKHSKCILHTTNFTLTLFEPLLKPALRDPHVPDAAIETAKEFILDALQDNEDTQDVVTYLQRRLVDLYLLGVLNESGKDIHNLAQLDHDDRGKNARWKTNLEDILIRFGQTHPKKLLDIMNECFVTPELRLQIIILLDTLASQPSFTDIANIVYTHPFMENIYKSLEIDNSSTVCAVELTLLEKILPAAAIKAYEPLKSALPRLFGILGRVLCWKSRIGQTIQTDRIPYSELLDHDDEALVMELEKEELKDEIEDLKESWQFKLKLREDLEWQRLERSFDMSTSSLPVPQQFFALLYFIFPCNCIHFLRNPISYLQEGNVESPWTVGWDDALDEMHIKTVGSTLLRSHLTHPSVLWHDRESELVDDERFKDYDTAKLISECMMLDAQMFNLSRSPDVSSKPQENASRMLRRESGEDATSSTPTVRTLQLEPPSFPRRRKVSLQDLIATSIALKTGAEINVSDEAPSWPSILFTPPPSTTPSTTPSRSNSVDPTIESSTSSSPTDEDKLPVHIAETISGLQREVLLLRTELNLELWIKRENIRHIRRLYKESIKTKDTEAGQLKLQNRLRDYRSKLKTLQLEIEKEKQQAEKIQSDQKEYITSLETKRAELRAQKRDFQEKEQNLLRRIQDKKERLEAQEKLLADLKSQVFELETQKKMDAPKINQIQKYEERIEQCNKQLQMWASDIVSYNQQSKKMEELECENEKLRRRIEENEQDLEKANDEIASQIRRIQVLEPELQSVRQQARKQEFIITQMRTESDELREENTALRLERDHLKEEIDDLRAGMDLENSGLADWLRQSR